MQKLYIIGNGFDLAHSRKTSYTDFANFLKSNCDPSSQAFIRRFEEKAFATLDYYMENNEDNLWSNIEHTLELMFQYDIVQDNLEEYRKLNVSYGDDNFHSRDYHNQEIAIEDDYSFCRSFNEHLTKWVNFIHKTPCQPLYHIRFSPQDRFLCFNYTNTLEEAYDIPSQQILYIHGKWSDRNLMIGHNTPCSFPDQTDGDIYEDIAGIEAFASAQDSVYKNVENIISSNHTFFNNLNSVDSIYVLGHSISDIDISYFGKIKEIVRRNTKWFISFYDDNDYEFKRKKLHELDIPSSNFKLASIKQILQDLN